MLICIKINSYARNIKETENMNKRQKILIVDDAKFLHLSAATGGKADGGDDTGVEYNKVFCHKASPLTPPP